MQGALVIFIAMVVIGLILYITDVFYYRKKYPDSPKEKTEESSESVKDPENDSCCGLHAVCEKTGLSPIDTEIIYYDDEELDRFKERTPDSYTPEEIEEFRDVLMTLLPEDVAGWSKSIQLRGIQLPDEIRDELLLIVTELREA